MSRSVTSSSTNQFRTVASSVGFSSGDYVYLTANGYGRIPDGTVGSATFPNTFTAPTYRPNATGGQSALQFDAIEGGASFSSNVAKLSNGNIVMVYFKGASETATTAPIYFKVVDSSGATIIAETQASSTNLGGPTGQFGAAVCGLANGGFAIAFTSSTNALIVRAFDSSGVATSSEISIATLSTAYRKVAIKGRSDSSFIVAYAASTNQPSYSVYSSTGTSLYTGTWGSTTMNSTSQWCAITVRSDDSFQLFSGSNATMQYKFLSSTNTTITSGSSNLTTGGNWAAIGATVLDSNVIVVVTVGATGGVRNYWSIAADTVGASQTGTLTTNCTQANGNNTFELARVEGTNNFVTIGVRAQTADTRGAGYGAAGLMCEFYDSSFTRLNTYPIYLTAFSSSSMMSGTTALTFGSNVRVYRSNVPLGSAVAFSYVPKGGVAYAVVSTVNYALGAPAGQSLTIDAGATPAFPVNLYARSGATANWATFAPTSNTITASSSAVGSVILAQTVIESANATAIDMKNLPDGGFAIMFTSAGTTIKLNIYNSSGVLQTSLTVATSVNGGNQDASMCVLANGKIVIVYRSSAAAGTLLCRVYQGSGSSYNLVASSNTLITSMYGESVTLAAVGDYSYFVVGHKRGANLPYVTIFNDSLTQIYTDEIRNDGEFGIPQVISDSTGDIMTWFSRYADNAGFCVVYRKSPVSNSTYVKLTNTVGSGANAESSPRYSFPKGNQGALLFGSNSYLGSSLQISQTSSSYNNGGSYTYVWPETQTNGLIQNSMSPGAQSTKAVAFVGNGDMVVFTNRWIGTNAAQLVFFTSNGIDTASWWNAVNIAASISMPLTSAFPCAVPLPGNRLAIACRQNATNFPTYAIVTGMSYDYPVQLVANVTPSTPLTLSLSNGYSLVGVAVTDCTAGGSGIIQTTGDAFLGTSYSSSISQSFSFRNYITEGRDGVVSGRSVILQGN